MDKYTALQTSIGQVVMLASGLGAAAILFCIAAYFTGKYAWRLWDNLTTIYRIECIQYWFKRMQDNGTHALRKEHDDKLTHSKEPTNG